ncbi:MAG: MBL fold metallo-hydrolase [Gemmatimonadota bacterium]|nr:MBL fold metallo-hydrolase [Gemmatimonadota bacterium]
MRITVLGSGSRGNAIALQSTSTTILVDAGFPLKELERRAAGAGLSLTGLDAVVLTHEHGDHATGAAALARAAGCPVVATSGTLRALGLNDADIATCELPHGSAIRRGTLDIAACRTSHDAADPVAVAVSDPGTGVRIAIAYDVGRVTVGLTRFLRSVHGLILEANHDDDMLRTGPYPARVRARIAGPTGHLSNRSESDLAAAVCHGDLQTVVLAHLSDRCNRPELAMETVRQALRSKGFRGRLLVAMQDEPVGPIEVGSRQYALNVFG